MNTKTFFLFGTDAVKHYNTDHNNFSEVVPLIIDTDFEIYVFDSAKNSTLDILNAYDGWGAYTSISESEYMDLKAFKDSLISFHNGEIPVLISGNEYARMNDISITEDRIEEIDNLNFYPSVSIGKTATMPIPDDTHMNFEDSFNYLLDKGFTISGKGSGHVYDVFKQGFEDSTMHNVGYDELIKYANELKGLPPVTILPEDDIPDARFPNGFDNWLQTYFEIANNIYVCEDLMSVGPIREASDKGGHCALYDIAKSWTNEFENKYAGTKWEQGDPNNYDYSFLDAIDTFVSAKLKGL